MIKMVKEILVEFNKKLFSLIIGQKIERYEVY